MKLYYKIALSVSVVVAAGIVIYIAKNSKKTKRMLTEIAEEGYETAQDILFPDENIHAKHLRYGPVIPE